MTCIESTSHLAPSGEARGSAQYQAYRLIGPERLSGEGTLAKAHTPSNRLAFIGAPRRHLWNVKSLIEV